jgi:hypothetical protein
MKRLTVITIAFLIISCSTYKRTNFEYHLGKKENEWINNFKTEFFFSCLKIGYKNDTIFKLISRKDFQYLYEPFAFQHNAINILATKIIKDMPKPIYPHCDDCTEKEEKEEAEKNYICASCLNYYASRELDSIAKKAYKEYITGKKESVLAN